eukprot:5808810-Alexandrium_andersonii.AAC.1
MQPGQGTSAQFQESLFLLRGNLLEPLRGALPSPGPPRLAPLVRAASLGGLSPPRTPPTGASGAPE